MERNKMNNNQQNQSKGITLPANVAQAIQRKQQLFGLREMRIWEVYRTLIQETCEEVTSGFCHNAFVESILAVAEFEKEILKESKEWK